MNFLKGKIYEIKVKPNSSRSEIIFDEEKKLIIVFLKSPPVDNKANLELIKLFKKKYKLNIEIIKGAVSKNKLIKILD